MNAHNSNHASTLGLSGNRPVGGLYDGADETSFRGAFLNDRHDVLSEAVLKEA